MCGGAYVSPSVFAHNLLNTTHETASLESIRYSCCASNRQAGTAWQPERHLFDKKKFNKKSFSESSKLSFYVREGEGVQFTVTQRS